MPRRTKENSISSQFTEKLAQAKQHLLQEIKTLVIDINEGGTTVTDEGSDVEIENYQHFVYVVNYLPQILQEMRENGQEINVVVIETIQKLRDMTLNDVMKNKSKKPTFND